MRTMLFLILSFLAVPALATEQQCQTWHLIGYPVIIDTHIQQPKSGTVVAIWVDERTRDLIALVELDDGRLMWRSMSKELIVDRKKRAEQLKQMQQPPPAALPRVPVQDAVIRESREPAPR